MVRRATASKKKNVITLDLSDVEVLGRFHEDGDYPLKVVEVEQKEGDKYDYLSWLLECTGDPEGARVYNNTSLSPQSLWNVRAMLEAVGYDIPDSEFDLDPSELVGLELMGKVEMEDYEGKPRPRLVDFWALEAAEEPKPKRGKKPAADDDEEDEKPARRSRRTRR